MARAKTEQVYEQEQQGTEQDADAQLTTGEQRNAQADETHVADDGVGLSAEPQPNNDGDDDGDYPQLIRQEGPSMRDIFAMAALQGMLANGTHQLRPDAVADKAFAFADAMLAIRDVQ